MQCYWISINCLDPGLSTVSLALHPSALCLIPIISLFGGWDVPIFRLLCLCVCPLFIKSFSPSFFLLLVCSSSCLCFALTCYFHFIAIDAHILRDFYCFRPYLFSTTYGSRLFCCCRCHTPLFLVLGIVIFKFCDCQGHADCSLTCFSITPFKINWGG